MSAALSSWSVHRALGPTYPGLDPYAVGRAATDPYGAGSLSLLDLPAAAAAHGIHALQICHFHFPRTDAAYLAELRARCAQSGVELLTLLIDEGDISAADDQARERDLAHIKEWIAIAAAVGARQARVIAGLARPDDSAAMARSSEGLAALAAFGADRSVRVITENWLALTMRPETLLAVLDGAGPAVGLCVDFGNYKGPGKYDELALLLPRADCTHAKADFPAPGQMDEADFRRCLDLARAAGFTGPHVLIFEGAGDEWASIDQMLAVAGPYL